MQHCCINEISGITLQKKTMNRMKINTLILFLLALCLVTFSSCDDDAPEEFNDEEFINKIELIFSPVDGNPVVVTAIDADGEGPGDLVYSDSIRLLPNTSYELFVSFENSISGEDITEEVEEEGEEHMLFYAFTLDLFSSPLGNGNIDNRADPLNYIDEDASGIEIGLITSWITGEAGSGSFELVLKHQPGVKTATSGAQDGETDISVSWGIVISE